MDCTLEQHEKGQNEHKDMECFEVSRSEYRIPGAVKMKGFSIRLTPLTKDVISKFRCSASASDHSSADNVLVCDDCDKSYHGDCPVHGPLIPLDESRGWDQDSKSFTSVPVPLQVTVKMSSIMNAGKGVFAKEFIPRRTRIGPYKGEVVQKEDITDETDTSYFFEAKKNGSESHYIDAKNEEHANWLRFINCARNAEEQNLFSFQYQGNIYYYTIKDILPGTELLVWYGEDYVKLLGLPIKYIIDANYTRAHCHAQFVEKYNFDLHMKYSQSCRDANRQVFKCGKCGEVFTTRVNLQQHIRRHEQNKSTEIHAKTRTGQKPHPCQYCSVSFYTKYRLSRHVRIHTGEKPYQCQHCNKLFTDSNGLRYHLYIHTNVKPYKCQYCGKCYKRKSSLTAHLLIHTEKKTHKCIYCKKSFANITFLRQHVLRHTGERPYQCQHCNKAFSSSSELRHHITIHGNGKPYKCQHCSKSFHHFTSLYRHIRKIHKGEKPHNCPHCSKAFYDKSQLRLHLRTHTGEKPHKCQYCSKSFGHLSNLRRHIKIHTGEKPYHCPNCSKSFLEKSKLKRHLLIHTSEKQC